MWDTWKNMALAKLSALLTRCVIAEVWARDHRDRARERNEGMRAKPREATDPEGLACLAHTRK